MDDHKMWDYVLDHSGKFYAYKNGKLKFSGKSYDTHSIWGYMKEEIYSIFHQFIEPM